MGVASGHIISHIYYLDMMVPQWHPVVCEMVQAFGDKSLVPFAQGIGVGTLAITLAKVDSCIVQSCHL